MLPSQEDLNDPDLLAELNSMNGGATAGEDKLTTVEDAAVEDGVSILYQISQAYFLKPLHQVTK